MQLKKVRLELGRTSEFPEGSPNHGYEMILPLRPNGQIDLQAWRADPAICRVLRFWGSNDDERGQLVQTEQGWGVSYAPGTEDDEPVYRLLDHRFAAGDYISITEHDGVTRPFRIVSIQDWHATEPVRPGSAKARAVR